MSFGKDELTKIVERKKKSAANEKREKKTDLAKSIYSFCNLNAD